MTRGFAAVLLALLWASGLAAAPAIEVTPSTAELAIGDRVELLVTVRVERGDDRHHVRFQAWGETLGAAEVLAVAPIEELPGPDDSTLYRQRLVLTLFQLGEVTLPPVEATVIDGDGETPLTSVSTKLTVRSVLPEDAAEIEAKPPAPPRRPDLGRPFWWAASALALTCLVALIALRRQTGDDDAATEERSRLAPMEEFRRSLAALRVESKPVPLHAELSLAVRRYLGRALSFQALESTTTEVRRKLREHQLPADVIRGTGDLLSACDMVKFARRNVDLTEARSRLDAAETIAGGVAAATAVPEPGSPEDADHRGGHAGTHGGGR
jgi:hypothetical protein